MGLKEHVEFCGYKSQADVADALSRADVFVLPSFAEGVPVVLMEALASQVPPVTSCIAGVPELVEDGVNGLLVPPGAAAPLAIAINTLLQDEELCKEMGRAGREKVVSEFSINTEATKLKQLFQQNAFDLDA
jgi:glycosyltransferase involved in cell wall biosynthesis